MWNFEGIKAIINIVIGIQSSISHMHWPLIDDEKEESVR